MSGFNINRFGKTLRWVVSVNFRKMLFWFTGSVLGVFLGEIVFQGLNKYGSPLNMLYDFSQFLMMILLVVSLILVSSIVSTVNEKRKREAFLMLPASNLEKFLSLVVYSTVICIACAILAIVLGDTLRMLGYWAVGYQGLPYEGESYYYSVKSLEFGEVYWWSSAIPMLIENIIPTVVASAPLPMDFTVIQWAFTVGGILWIHSIYTLGGTLLRKYSFVVTNVFVILCVILVVRMIITFDMTLFHSRWDNGELIEYEIGAMGWILAIAFPVFSVLNYWASYRIFKGFELITNKWTNYDFFKR